jgi:hypothetical protein
MSIPKHPVGNKSTKPPLQGEKKVRLSHAIPADTSFKRPIKAAQQNIKLIPKTKGEATGALQQARHAGVDQNHCAGDDDFYATLSCVTGAARRSFWRSWQQWACTHFPPHR